jgi:hypothetical protein
VKRANFPRRKAKRADEAVIRQAVSDGRSYGQRMSLIERRPGMSSRELATLTLKVAS